MLKYFFFNDQSTTEIYTLSLHDALPIYFLRYGQERSAVLAAPDARLPLVAVDDGDHRRPPPDRKSTRLNSSHGYISYAVFCLKKKNRIDYLYNRNYFTKNAVINSFLLWS